MNDDKTISQQDIEEATVRFKPIFGIAPRRYLAAAYGIALLAMLFLTLLLPGIRRPGSTWSFNVDPPGSAVFVDGVYRGHAPCEIFLPAGERSIRVERPGFVPAETVVRSTGRLIATWPFPNRASMSLSLVPVSGIGILEDGMRAYASWALSGSPSDAYQIPMALSDAARSALVDPGSTRAAVGGHLAGAALSYALHAQSVRDATRATAILYGGSATVTPASLGRLVSSTMAELAVDPAMLPALVAALPPAVRTRLEASVYYRKVFAGAAVGTAVKLAAGSRTAFAGREFVPMPAGTAVLKASGAMDASVAVQPFYLASGEVTVGEFRAFLTANPDWGPGSANSLRARGLVESDYLSGFAEAADADALRFVSRPAAIAYCAWLSSAAPAGYRFALPTEAQWALAAASAGTSPATVAVFVDSGATGPARPADLRYDSSGLRGMLGNLWEWCSDSFATHPAAGIDGRNSFVSTEAVVRGGSWANRSDLVNLASRGPMPETACTAYLGFRIAMVQAR